MTLKARLTPNKLRSWQSQTPLANLLLVV
ncbi:MAG: hypothetical protein J7L92_05255 [Dehalococcoidia bacterium]|nr:hypothetical protein [Dehalococcoidia bacterium]